MFTRSQPTTHCPPTLAEIGREFLVVAAFNTLIAVCLNLTYHGLGSFGSVLLYSQCIGLSIYACHAATQFLPLPGSVAVQLVERGLISAPIGFSLGARLAAWLVGDPTPVLMIFSMPPVALVTTVVATVIIVYFLWSRDRIREEQTAQERATRLALETQLKLLRAQIEPHMLFNTLANLRSLVETDVPAALLMLDELIVFLRGTLTASRAETGPLSAEFEVLRAYLELMQVRIGKRLAFTLDLDESLASASVPSMLLQPLVENAIKHGIEPAIAGGHIGVSARAAAGVLTLTVEDTGQGLGTSAQPTGDGYGLTNVRERLFALYAGRAQLSIRDLVPHGVSVRIDLPQELPL